MSVLFSLFSTKNEGIQSPSSSSWFSKGNYSNSDMKDIWEKTHQDLQRGHYTLKGKTISLEPHLSASVSGTYKRTISLFRWIIEGFWKSFSSKGYDTKVGVVDRDAIVEAISLKEQGYNPALLNPANAYRPGGGYKWGARAMEEDICRRSGLAHAIDSAHGKVKDFYSLKGPELLYNPSVPIYRHGREKQYAYMEKPVDISMITSAAVDLNPRHKSDRIYQENHQMFLAETERRIYAQLATAAENGHDSVVLTAFGCGAFRCSPDEVAGIYKKVIEAHFQGVFKLITFAIIDDHNTGYAHNPRGNFRPFNELFR